MKKVNEEKVSKRWIYEELKKEMEMEENNRILKKMKHAGVLFRECNNYYKYYQIYRDLQEPIKVLKNYIDEDELLSKAAQIKRKRNNNDDESGISTELVKRKVKQELENQLYAEFFTKIYIKYYSNVYSFSEVINKQHLITEILKEQFPDIEKHQLKEIEKSVVTAYENTYKKINLEGLHNAMKKYKQTVEKYEKNEKERKTKMEMERELRESVTHVLSEGCMKLLIEYLRNENIMGFIFYQAQIVIALTDGTYHKHIACNGEEKTESYFNISCQYNLNELKNYIGVKDHSGLKGLYERYDMTIKSLAKLKTIDVFRDDE